VSLTHTRGEAAALAALVPDDALSGVGIDIEQLAPRPDGFAAAALTDSERGLLEPLSADAREEWLLRLWCAREAVAKALGVGIGPRTDAARASAIDPLEGSVTIEVDGRTLVARTHRDGGMLVATALAPALARAVAAQTAGRR
jgi:phosphopantetheine--protein transferase-like protein